MKIAQLTRYDWSGAGYALKQAFDAATDHECRHMSMKRTWIKYPYDILGPNETIIRRYLDWADLWIIHDDGEELLPSRIKRKPTIKVYHGTYYRKNYKSINRQDRRKKNVQTCLTQDLSVFGPKWIGRAIPDLTAYRAKQDVFRVVQCPAKAAKKGTKYVAEALKDIPGVQFDLVTRIPYKRCLIRKGRADVLIDQVGPLAYGYGTNALEAWAMGIPVISGCTFEVKNRIMDILGENIPFVDVNYGNICDNIKEAVQTLKESTAHYKRMALMGTRYVDKWHSAQYVTNAMLNLL